jgi:benzoate-CoA ligase family protein
MEQVPESYNVSTMLDANLSAGRSAKTAIICGDERISYAELFGRVCRMGRGLRGLGVRPGERVMLVLGDSPLLAAAFFGALRIGAVPCLLNPLFQEDAYRHFVSEAGAAVVVADEACWEKVARSVSDISSTTVLAPTATRGQIISIDEVLAGSDEALAPASTHREDMAFWLYSSGSTGRPKAIIHAHQDIPATCTSYARHILNITDRDVCFARALFHAYGLGGGLTFPIWAGATSILDPRRATPAGLLETINHHRPSLLFLVPALYKAILDDAAAASADLHMVRHCISASEPLSSDIWHRWRKTFGSEIMDGIGSTELLNIFCSNAPGAVKPGSSGKPVPGYKLRLVDEDGMPIEKGNVGFLQVHGQGSSLGYWRQRAKTQQVMIGPWIATGDRYRVDDDGFYWYQGRTDDMMKIGGEWVSPVQLENVLMEHPAVAEAAVTGFSADGLTRIRAWIVLTTGRAGSDELARGLREWCKSHLERYQYPHVIDFVDELPRTALGKIERFKLRGRP